MIWLDSHYLDLERIYLIVVVVVLRLYLPLYLSNNLTTALVSYLSCIVFSLYLTSLPLSVLCSVGVWVEIYYIRSTPFHLSGKLLTMVLYNQSLLAALIGDK